MAGVRNNNNNKSNSSSLHTVTINMNHVRNVLLMSIICMYEQKRQFSIDYQRCIHLLLSDQGGVQL